MFADIKPKASRLTSTFSLFRSNYSLFETRVPTGSRSALSRIVTWQAMGSHGADPRVYSFLCVHRHTSAVCLLICHWRPAPHSCHRRPSLDMGVETYLYAIIVDSVGSHGIFVYDTKVYRTTQLFVARKKKMPIRHCNWLQVCFLVSSQDSQYIRNKVSRVNNSTTRFSIDSIVRSNYYLISSIVSSAVHTLNK